MKGDVNVLKFDSTLTLDKERLTEALKKVHVNNVCIPLIHVKDRGTRIAFVSYGIYMDDPIYEKIKDEDEEGMAEACKPAYFLMPKSRQIDYHLLIEAIQNKVKGVMRKQRKIDASA